MDGSKTRTMTAHIYGVLQQAKKDCLAELFAYVHSFKPQDNSEIGTVITPILQRRKLRYREAM